MKYFNLIRSVLHSCFFSYGCSAVAIVITHAIAPHADVNFLLLLRALLIAGTIAGILNTLIYSADLPLLMRRVIATAFTFPLFSIAVLLSDSIKTDSIRILHYIGISLLAGGIATALAFLIADRTERVYLSAVNRALEQKYEK